MELDERESAIVEGQKLALNGKAKEAEEYFKNLCKQGIPEGSVALAQIYAFQGEWEKVLGYGKIFLQNPTISYNYWPFQEAMRKLIVRAVKMTGKESQFEIMADWSKAVARAALGVEPWAEESFIKGLDDMLVAVGLKPKPEETATVGEERKLSKEEKIKKYEQEVKEVVDDPVLGKDKRHVAKISFLKAKLYNYEEEMIRVYLDNEDTWGERPTDFEDVLSVAKILVQEEKDTQAWEVISKKLKFWQPEEFHEVAPIDLLDDDVLFCIMTLQRCEVVLSTKYELKLKELAELGLRIQKQNNELCDA